MHKSFFFAQITVGLLHALEDEVEIVCQVLANFLVASLADFAHISNELLVCALHIPVILKINLKSDILDWVLIPNLVFTFINEQKR